MTKIALSPEVLERFGTQIQQTAPGQVELRIIGQDSARDAEILINSEFPEGITLEACVANMPRVRWIHSVYAGLDDIPWTLIAARRIIVTNSAGVYAPMMAEYVMAMLVTMFRNLQVYVSAQREHRWSQFYSLEYPNEELLGKRMGIIGYGAIGRQLATLASAWGMRVWATRRTPSQPYNEPVERMLGASAEELSELLRACDAVVITASLNSSTRKLLGQQEFAMMKRNAVLVNVARGAILDENALVNALEQRILRGAVLDVTTQEPMPPDSPLWDAPNLILTPHISGNLDIGRDRSIDLFCQNLRLYLDGNTDAMGNRVSSHAHS